MRDQHRSVASTEEANLIARSYDEAHSLSDLEKDQGLRLEAKNSCQLGAKLP